MSTQTRTQVVFMRVEAFKKALGIDKLEVVLYDKGPKATNKLSLMDEFGNFYRCQQSIDKNKPMRMLLEKGKDISEACLVNVSSDGESPLTPQFSL